LKVLTCHELESKDALLPLLDHAFNWIFDERQFGDFIVRAKGKDSFFLTRVDSF
jgi:hypothetical protein